MPQRNVYRIGEYVRVLHETRNSLGIDPHPLAGRIHQVTALDSHANDEGRATLSLGVYWIWESDVVPWVPQAGEWVIRNDNPSTLNARPAAQVGRVEATSNPLAPLVYVWRQTDDANFSTLWRQRNIRLARLRPATQEEFDAAPKRNPFVPWTATPPYDHAAEETFKLPPRTPATAEIPAPPVTPPPAPFPFEEGARIRVNRRNADGATVQAGDEGTIQFREGRGWRVTMDEMRDSRANWFFEEESMTVLALDPNAPRYSFRNNQVVTILATATTPADLPHPLAGQQRRIRGRYTTPDYPESFTTRPAYELNDMEGNNTGFFVFQDQVTPWEIRIGEFFFNSYHGRLSQLIEITERQWRFRHVAYSEWETGTLSLDNAYQYASPPSVPQLIDLIASNQQRWVEAQEFATGNGVTLETPPIPPGPHVGARVSITTANPAGANIRVGDLATVVGRRGGAGDYWYLFMDSCRSPSRTNAPEQAWVDGSAVRYHYFVPATALALVDPSAPIPPAPPIPTEFGIGVRIRMISNEDDVGFDSLHVGDTGEITGPQNISSQRWPVRLDTPRDRGRRLRTGDGGYQFHYWLSAANMEIQAPTPQPATITPPAATTAPATTPTEELMTSPTPPTPPTAIPSSPNPVTVYVHEGTIYLIPDEVEQLKAFLGTIGYTQLTTDSPITQVVTIGGQSIPLVGSLVAETV